MLTPGDQFRFFMLWACLHFSDLPLHVLFEDGERELPCAAIDGPEQRQRIVFANRQAQHHGVRIDQPLASARALCASLQARVRSRTAENHLLRNLAAWAYQFSSHIALSGNDALLIEIGASLNLFGGWPALEHRLRRELLRIGHAPALAVAPVPAAARVLATAHDGLLVADRESMRVALGRMPIADSGLDPEVIALLYNVGLRTLRDVFALPRPELARRIGPGALVWLDHLRGDESEILSLYRPPDRFEQRVELDHLIEAWPPLLFPLRRLCHELALFLAARDGGVQRCELVLEHEDHVATRLAIELLTPQREAKTLYELVRGRLERTALEQAISGIALIARDLPTLRPQHQDLFEAKRAQALDWPELAERLRAHLGDSAVRQLATVADHRPERAWRFDGARCSMQASIPAAVSSRHPASPSATARDALQGITQTRRLRPFWLLPRALPLRGVPQRILAGPERIESGWWDGDDTRRDYYLVQTREGQRAWAFLAAGTSEGWMLHGWFA